MFHPSKAVIRMKNTMHRSGLAQLGTQQGFGWRLFSFLLPLLTHPQRLENHFSYTLYLKS